MSIKVLNNFIDTGCLFGSWTPQNVWDLDGPQTTPPPQPMNVVKESPAACLMATMPQVEAAFELGATKVVLNGFKWGTIPAELYNKDGVGNTITEKKWVLDTNAPRKPLLADVIHSRYRICEKQVLVQSARNICAKTKRTLRPGEVKQIVKATGDPQHPLFGIPVTKLVKSIHPVYRVDRTACDEKYITRGDLRLLSTRQRQKAHKLKWEGHLIIDDSLHSTWASREHWVLKDVTRKSFTKYVKVQKPEWTLVEGCSEREQNKKGAVSKTALKKMSTAQRLALLDENFSSDVRGHCWRNIFTDALTFGQIQFKPKHFKMHRFGKKKGSFLPLTEFVKLIQEEIVKCPTLADLIVPKPFCYREGNRLVYHVGYSRLGHGWCKLQSLASMPKKSGNHKVPKDVLMNAVVGAEPMNGNEFAEPDSYGPTFKVRSWAIPHGTQIGVLDLDMLVQVKEEFTHASELNKHICTFIRMNESLHDCHLRGWCHKDFFFDVNLPNGVNKEVRRQMDKRSIWGSSPFLPFWLMKRRIEEYEPVAQRYGVTHIQMPYFFTNGSFIFGHVGNHYCGRTIELKQAIHLFWMLEFKQMFLNMTRRLVFGASTSGNDFKKKIDEVQVINIRPIQTMRSVEETVQVTRNDLLRWLKRQQDLREDVLRMPGEISDSQKDLPLPADLCALLNNDSLKRELDGNNVVNRQSVSAENGEKQQRSLQKFWNSKWMPILKPLLGISSLEVLQQIQCRGEGSWLDLGLSNKVFQMTTTVAIRSLQTYFAAKVVKGVWTLSKSELHTHVLNQVNLLQREATAEVKHVKQWYQGVPASIKILIVGAIFMGSVQLVRKLFNVRVMDTDGKRADSNFSEVVRVSVSQRQAYGQSQPSKQAKMFMTAAGMVATISMFLDVRTAKYIKEWMDLWWYAVTSATQMGNITDLIMSPREYLKSVMNPSSVDQHAFNQRFLNLIKDAEQNSQIQSNSISPGKEFVSQRQALGGENPISEVQGYLLHEIRDQVSDAPFTYMNALKGLSEIKITTESMFSIARDFAEGNLQEKIYLLNAPTGSGKSTIFPTYVNAKTNKRILILVPLVAAALGIFKRLEESLGSQVGYHADKTSANVHAKVVVSTYGHIAHQLMQNQNPYEKYGIILADECHVTTLETAVVITDLLAKRNILQQQVMFMTATPFKHLDLESVQTEQDITQIKTNKFQSVKSFINYCKEGGEQRIAQTAENGCIIFCATHKETTDLASFLHSPAHPAIAYHASLRMPLGEFIEKHKAQLGKIPYFICATNAIESGVTIPARTCIDFSTKMISQVEGDRHTISMARQTITMPEQIQRRGRVARTQPGIFFYTHVGEQNIVKLDPDSSVKYMLNCWINKTVCCKEICDLPDESNVRITRSMVPMVWCHDIPPLVMCSLMDHLGCIYQNALCFTGAFQSVPGQMPGTTTMLDAVQVAKFHTMQVTAHAKDEVKDLKVPQPHFWFDEPRTIALWENLIQSSSFELTPGECSERKNLMLERLESQVAFNSTSTDLDLASILVKMYENLRVYRQQISAMQSFTANTLDKTGFLDRIPLLAFANKNIRNRSDRRVKELEEDIHDTESCISFLEARLTGDSTVNLALEKTEQDKIKEYLACLMDLGYASGSFQSCFFVRETTWKKFQDLVEKRKDGTYQQKSFMKRIIETAQDKPWISLTVCGAGVALCCYALLNTCLKTQEKEGLIACTENINENVIHRNAMQYQPECMPYAGTFVREVAVGGAAIYTFETIKNIKDNLIRWWQGEPRPKMRVALDENVKIGTTWFDIYENDIWLASFETLTKPENPDQVLTVCKEFEKALETYKNRFLKDLKKHSYVPEGKGTLRAHRTKALKAEKTRSNMKEKKDVRYYDPYSEGKTRSGLKKVFRQFYNVDDADVKEIILHGQKGEPVLIISSLDALNAEVERMRFSDPQLYSFYQDVKDKLTNAIDDDVEKYLDGITQLGVQLKNNDRWADVEDDSITEMINALSMLVKEANEQSFIPVTITTYDGRTIQATVANYRGKWQETSWPRIEFDGLRKKLDDALKLLPEGFISKTKNECTLEQKHEIDELIKCVLHEKTQSMNREAVMPGTQCQTDSCDWTPRVGIVHRKSNDGEFSQLFLQCIALNNVCIYPYHGWLKEGEELQFHFPTTTFIGKMRRCEEFSNNDIAYTPLPKRIKGVSGGVILSKPSEKENIFHYSRIVSQKVKTEAQYQGFSSTAHIDGNCWAHTVPTQMGSCGGPILNQRGHLIGYHVGTAGDFSYNDFLGFSDQLIKSIRKIDVNRNAMRQGCMQWRETEFYKTSNYLPPMLNKQAPIPEEWQAPGHKDIKRCTNADWMATELLKGPSFELLGKMTRMVDYNTKISKNQDFALWFNLESTKCELNRINESRRLKNLEPLRITHTISAQNREAAILDTSKYNRVTTYAWSDELLKKSTQMVIDLLEPYIQKCTRQPLELVYQDMEWSTACGARYDGLKADFRTKVVGETNMMAYGEYAWARFDVPTSEYVPTIWTNSLKDELRPIEKVQLNKTRTFTAAPIDFVVGAKQAVDQFNHQFMAHHLTLPHTVGINQWAGGWQRLFMKLEGKNFLYSSGDGSRFDSSPTSEIFDAIYTIRCHFADASLWQVLSNIYTEICFTPIVLHDGNIVKKDHGNNSGQCSTVIDNSLTMLILCCASYLEHTPPSWHSVKQMNDHWHFCVNGDDYIGGMSPSLANLLTKEKMSKTFETFQFKYEWTEYTNDLFAQEYMSLKFIKLNADNVLSNSKPLVAPWRDGSRQLSTLSHTTSFEPWIKLQVALTERIKAWVDKDLFNFITDYAKWYMDQIRDSCQRKEWQEVQALWWDEQHIFNHYFSRESALIYSAIELFASMPEGEDVIWGPHESFVTIDEKLVVSQKPERLDHKLFKVCFCKEKNCQFEHTIMQKDFNQKDLLKFCDSSWIGKLQDFDAYELPESLWEQQKVLFHMWFNISRGFKVADVINKSFFSEEKKFCNVAKWFSRQIIGVYVLHYQNDNGKMGFKDIAIITGKSSEVNNNQRQAMSSIISSAQHMFSFMTLHGINHESAQAQDAWNALTTAQKADWQARWNAIPVISGHRSLPNSQAAAAPIQTTHQQHQEEHQQHGNVPYVPQQGGAHVANNATQQRQYKLSQKYGNLLTVPEPQGFKQDVMGEHAIHLVENRWARRCGLAGGHALSEHPTFWRYLFTYVCNNSTSTAGNLEQEFEINGHILRMAMLIEDADQHGGWRRFWRAKADDLYDYLSILKEHGETMPRDWAKKNGFPPEYSQLGFDVVDYCTNLSPQELKVLSAVKARAVPRNRGVLVGTSLKPNTGGAEETYGAVDRDIMRDLGGGSG